MANAYIINTFRVPKTVKIYILDNLLINYNKSTQQFFVHVLLGTLISYNKKENGWVPVCFKLMRKEWGSLLPNWRQLVEDNLIELKILGEVKLNKDLTIEQTYSIKDNLSRQFRVTDQVITTFLDSYPEQTEDYIECTYYNLMSGKRMNVFKRHKLTDDSGNSIPDLIKNSMLSVKRCVINDKAIKDFLTDKRIDAILFGTKKDELKAKNDDFCYKALRKTGIKMLKDGLVEYYPSYKTQMSGRISEEGGGLQSCSREMKEVAFSKIPNLKNYDLKSSQVWGLIQWFEIANIESSWLTQYLSKDKKEYANQVGISVDRWKQCFMALVFAAELRKKVSKKTFEADKISKVINGVLFEKEEGPDEAILNALWEEANRDADVALDYYSKFYKIVEPLRKGIEAWQDWLLKEYIPLNTIYGKGIPYAINRTGITFCLGNYKNSQGDWVKVKELKRKISAFYLQGNEAAFIHSLTWISEYYQFEVISNQHDGVVTLGEIPQAAIEKAKEMSGLKYAFLEEKPLN